MNKQLFDIVEPNINLKSSIMKTIEKAEMKKTIYKMVSGSVLSLVSIFAVVFYTINIFNDAQTSGLSEYLSLIVSDSALVMSYWQTYIMSIVESLPIVPITIVVASVWIFVWSMNSLVKVLKSTKNVFYKTN
jgi:hypothetical protein